MNTLKLFDTTQRSRAWIAFVICCILMVGAVITASLVQRDFGNVEVCNVTYENFNGIPIRAKLLKPVVATAQGPVPGVVYIHGYQNNRETSDAYAIEMARRGFVVLAIDAIGRGNSGLPNAMDAPDFDVTYGGKTSFAYLKSLPYVDADRVGMMGHSLGAEMAYAVALADPTVQALSISGFAYREDATEDNPKNMLMIFGRWDEYRARMTGTRDFAAEWMRAPQTQQVIAAPAPEFSVTYGDFVEGTARRVFMPNAIHIQESHNHAAVAEAVAWMRQALRPPDAAWRDPADQIWALKEWATLVAMVACFAALLPLTLMLLRTRFFSPLQRAAMGTYACTGRPFLKHVVVNGALMWLYIPLIMVLFAVHLYVVPIDKVFPMMMVNGIIGWFVGINLIGALIFRRWFKRESTAHNLSLVDLGVSERADRLAWRWDKLGRTALLALVLFAFAYASEHVLESLFIVDFRFVFPFASDLTPYRALMVLLYFPFLFFGFWMTGAFLHGKIRRPPKKTWWQTFASWSLTNVLVQVVPLLLFLLVQYLPLFVFNVIPLVGPGGVMATFIMNLFHIIGVLLLMVPISTWCYQLTGNITLGALLNAALVAWMFASSQVIAPIPV